VTGVIMAALAAYTVGCVCSGYYLVRISTGEDIRRSGSGAAGATNVARRLGRTGFAVTFALDCLKGVAVAWTARRLELDATSSSAVVIAVIVGHIWPAQLRFHGGKGIATSLGAFAIYEPRSVAAIVILSGVWFLVWREWVAAGLLAYLIAPAALMLLDVPADRLLTLAAASCVVLVAHHQNIRSALAVRGRTFAAGAGARRISTSGSSTVGRGQRSG
jgi:acyl phosphate:glycerol-3-phosphate acyltransferase